MKRPKFLCYDFFIDLIYPAHCPACGCVTAWDKVLCDDCESRLEYIEGVPWQAVFPADIDGKYPAFDYANALFRYEGTARLAVLSYKDRRGTRLADYSARRIIEKLASDDADNVDYVTFVPMHFLKRFRRGYDQAEVFARAVSREMNVPLLKGVLARKYTRKAQHELKRSERYKSAERAYYIKERLPLDGKRVLLCDDILTTGATADSCARLLKELGAEKVYIAAICRTLPSKQGAEEK